MQFFVALNANAMQHFLILDINIIAFASSRNNGSVEIKQETTLKYNLC
jgi:hypothetical protein